MPSMRNENPISLNSPSVLKAWFLATRPKTWMASICPVLIGTALAAKEGHFQGFLFGAVLLFALLIQIGTNFANDYFDFIKGADTRLRKGPKRAVEQGWISPPTMLKATFLTFGAAFAVAIPLMFLAGWWSFSITAVAILFGLLYTGGPRPLGYLGLGELLVFPFFGPIAVCGAYFLQTFSFSFPIFIASLSPGFLSCAILVANNLRDEATDRTANKKTLVVRFGHLFGCFEYTLLIAAAAAIPFFYFGSLLPSLIFPAALPLIRKAFAGQNLLPLLPGTSLLLALYTLLFCLSLL